MTAPAPTQRVVVYTDHAGRLQVYTTVYADQDEAGHLLGQCRLRHPDAKSLALMDASKVATSA